MIPQQSSFENVLQASGPVPDFHLTPTNERIRRCNFCQRVLPVSNFGQTVRASSKGGFIPSVNRRCKDCTNELQTRLRPRYKDKASVYHKARYQANPYAKRIQVMNVRAKKLGVPGEVTLEEWNALKEQFNNRCAYCGVSSLLLHLDHIFPLSEWSRGCKLATNDISNILPACVMCNRAKGDSPVLLFLAWRHGLLR